MITISLSKYPAVGKHYFEGFCLSTDTKPDDESVFNGSFLFEMDTGKACFFDADAGEWIEPGAGGVSNA